MFKAHLAEVVESESAKPKRDVSGDEKRLLPMGNRLFLMKSSDAKRPTGVVQTPVFSRELMQLVGLERCVCATSHLLA